MTEERKVQLGVGVDATEARQGFGEVKDAGRDMAQSVAQSGQQAAEGMAAIAKGADQAVDKLDRATRSMSSLIAKATAENQRLKASFETGSSSGADYLENYARQRGAAMEKLRPQIDILRQLESEMSVFQARERELASFSAFEKKAADAAKLNQASEYIRFWEESLRKAEAAEKQLAGQNAFVTSLKAQADAIGKTRADLLEMQAAQLGVTGQAAPFIARLREAEGGVHGLGLSAGQTANALRQVPMQFTDIVTSLAAGQAPLQVFLQQGGQLKDTFGGAGAAARALGGYVVGLINPFTLTAAAVAGLAIAYKQGSDESDRYAKSLILSGNAAKTSVNQLQNIASSVVAVAGATKGAAADVLAQLVDTGKVTEAVLSGAAATAVSLEKTAGKAVAETVKEFAELGRSPVDASKKLNDQYNYLTADVYKQIKALEEQGRTQDAAALAQKTFADAMKERAEQVKQSLGSLETGWNSIKSAAKNAWDAMLDIGREGSLEERISKIKAQLAAVAQGKGYLSGGVGFGGEQEARAQLAVLEAQLTQQKKVAQAAGEKSDKEKAGIQWIDESNKYLSKQAQQQKEIARIRELGAQAGASEAEIQRRIFEVQRGDWSSMLDARIAGVREAASAEVNLIQDAVKLGTRSELSGIEAVKAARIKAAQDEVALLSRKYGAAESGADRLRLSAEMRKASEEASRAIADADVQLKALEEKHAAALGKFAAMSTESLTPLQQAWQKFWNENAKTVQEAQQNGWNDVIDQMQKAWASVADKTNIQSAKSELDTLFSRVQLGISDVDERIQASGGSWVERWVGSEKIYAITQQAIPGLIAKIEELRDKLAELPDGSGLAAGLEQDITKYERQLSTLRRSTAKSWSDVVSGIDKTFHDGFSAMLLKGEGGFKAWCKSFENTFETTVADAMYQFFARPFVLNLIANVAGMAGLNGMAAAMSQAAGGGNSMLGMASNASSLYNLANGSYLAGAQSLYNQYIAGSSLFGATAPVWSATGAAATGSGGLGLTAAGGTTGLTATGGAGLSGTVAGYGTAEAGAAGTGAGVGSSSGAMASAWPLAIIAGMYMSSQLLKSGYKYDNEAFKTDDPKSWSMLLFDGAYKEANAVGKLFGQDNFGDSKFWQIATGAPLARYVDEAVQKFLGIRGGAPKAEAWSNIAIQADGTTANSAGTAQFGSNLGATHGSSTETIGAVNSMLVPMAMYISNVAKELGASAEGLSVVLGFNTDPGGDAPDNITGGVTDAQGNLIYRHIYDADRGTYQKEMAAELGRITLAALQGIDINSITNDYLDRLDIAGMTNEQTAAAMQMLQSFKSLGQAMADLNLGADSLTTGLVAAFGGVEGLHTKLNSYYSNYYTAEEQRARTVQQITDTLNAAGANLTTDIVGSADRAGFRAWLESIPAANETLRAAALQVEDEFAGITAAISSTATAVQQSAAEIAKAAQTMAQSATDAALSAVQRAVSSEQTALQAKLEAAQERVADLSGLQGLLKTTLDDIYGSSAQTQGSQLSAAQAFISSASATAQASGYLPEFESLQSAISTVRSSQTADNFATATDFARSQLQLASQLDALKGVVDPQLKAAERAVALAENQLSVLDQQLLLAQTQVDALRGIDTSVLSVTAAIGGLQAAIIAEQQATNAAIAAAASSSSASGSTGAGGTTTGTPDATASYAQQVADLYENMLGRSADLGGQSYWASAAEAAGSVGAILDAFRKAAIASGEIPKFAAGGSYAGGLALVGERGPEIINFRNPGQVYNAGQTAELMGGGAQTAREIAALREEQRQQAASVAGFMARFTKVIEKWDSEGMPEATV